jgi:hypothetical protein
MRVLSLVSTLSLSAALFVACSGSQSANSAANSNTTASGGAPAAAASPAANADPDQSANGSGVPAGYVGRTDDASKSIADAKYAPAAGGGWDVETGPAHILYKATDTASGSYTLHTQIDQLESPHHPEAYGVFFGGQHLTDSSQRYTYFIVRGNGMYAIKARDGASARTVVEFTVSPNVPKADASGKASYAITVHVAPDAVHFIVNDKPVATLPKGSLAIDGIAGIRINHNLHVSVTPLTIRR